MGKPDRGIPRVTIATGSTPCPNCGPTRVRRPRDRGMNEVFVGASAVFIGLGVAVAVASIDSPAGVASGLSLAAMAILLLTLWFRFRGPTLSRHGWVLCQSCGRLEVGSQPAPDLVAPRRRGEFWFSGLLLWLYLPAIFYLALWASEEGVSPYSPWPPDARFPVAEGCLLLVATLAGVAGRGFVPAK